MGKAPLPHNKRNCYPPYPDHYLILIKGDIIIMIYTETLCTVILSVCNLIFSTNKETFASFGKMFNVS